MLKSISAFFLIMSVCIGVAKAAEERSPLFDLSGATPALTPKIDRRDFSIPDIDTENFEIGAYYGIVSVENFGANFVKGVNASFFATEDFFLTGNVSFSSINDRAYRQYVPLFGESGSRDVKEYSLLLGWNVMPGEFFWIDKQAFTSDLYILAGMGTVSFDAEEHGSYVAGIGIRIIPRDWFAIRFESKVSEYTSSILGYEKHFHNVDMVAGISVFF